MFKLHRRTLLVLILDGTVGSGKTTIAKFLIKRNSARIISLSAFGFPVYHIIFLLVVLKIGLKATTMALRSGYHPLSLLDRKLLHKLGLLIILGELVCRFFYFLRLLVSSLVSPIVIIDEGFVNTMAFYYWFYSNVSAFGNILLRFHLRFMARVMESHHVISVFVDSSHQTLIRTWFKRRKPVPLSTLGFSIRALTTWCNIIRATYRVLSNMYSFHYLVRRR